MFFKSRDSFNKYLINTCKSIGVGSQAECFLGPDNKVYKVYHDSDIYDDESPYTEDFLLRFKGLNNNTFTFADDVICANGKIIGHISNFIPGKPLSDINPLTISLDSFEENILKSRSDIADISSNNIKLYDICYNMMVRNNDNSFFIKDFDEFSYSTDLIDSEDLFNKNRKTFDVELYLFLVDNLFDEFVSQYPDLKELYTEKNEDVLFFLKLFRKYLSECAGEEIKCLGNAINCLNDNCENIPRYPRFF